MSDLDDEILALMGGDAPVRNEPSRRKTHTSGVHTSEGEDSTGSYGTPDISRLVDDEYDGPVDAYDEEYYGDAEDRRYLNTLSQLEREQVLHERAERRQQLLERREVRKKLREGERASEQQRRRSERVPTRSEAHAKGRERLKRLREDKDTIKKSRARGSGDEDEEYRSRAREYSSSEDEEMEEAAKEEEGEGDKVEAVTREDFEGCRLTRTLLEKWVNMPFFDRTAVGGYMRNLIGRSDETGENVYRLVRIEEVVEGSKAYMLGTTMTKKTAICTHGKAARRFNFEFASNGPLRTREVERYVAACKGDGIKVPRKAQLVTKAKDFAVARKYTLTNEEVDEMIRVKREMLGRSTVEARRELVRERDAAFEEGDAGRVGELDAALLALDERTAQTRADPKMVALAQVNARNRERTVMDVRAAEDEARAEKRRGLRGEGAPKPVEVVRTASVPATLEGERAGTYKGLLALEKRRGGVKLSASGYAAAMGKAGAFKIGGAL